VTNFSNNLKGLAYLEIQILSNPNLLFLRIYIVKVRHPSQFVQTKTRFQCIYQYFGILFELNILKFKILKNSKCDARNLMLIHLHILQISSCLVMSFHLHVQIRKTYILKDLNQLTNMVISNLDREYFYLKLEAFL